MKSHKRNAVLLEVIRTIVDLERRKALFRPHIDKAVSALVEILYSKNQTVVYAALRTACNIACLSSELAAPIADRFIFYSHGKDKNLVLIAVSALLRISDAKKLPDLLLLLESAIPNAGEELVMESLKGFSCAVKRLPELEKIFTNYLSNFWKAGNTDEVHSKMLEIIKELIPISDIYCEKIIEMIVNFLNNCTSIKIRNAVIVI